MKERTVRSALALRRAQQCDGLFVDAFKQLGFPGEKIRLANLFAIFRASLVMRGAAQSALVDFAEIVVDRRRGPAFVDRSRRMFGQFTRGCR